MLNSFFASLSLLNVSGVLILVAIAGLFVSGVAVTLMVRGRWAAIERDLRRNGDASANFQSAVLTAIARDAIDAQRGASEVNTQAIVEQHVQSDLHRLLVGERYVKATTGLLIIHGLVGTFYGLTMSIGKLVALVSGDVAESAEVTQALTRGLTDALSGMSVAFSSSLFGILAAILMTLLGVFLSVGDRRTSVMVQIEAYLDNVLLARSQIAEPAIAAAASSRSGGARDARLEQALVGFGQSIDRLDGVVAQFESALANFATTTRDFREFNHHLKDNVQRMSLSFSDLAEALKQEARRPRDGR
jgi:hypothetical protein